MCWGQSNRGPTFRLTGQDAFLDWISSLASLRDPEGNPIFMPIDGKTMRGSYTKADKSDMLHIVSAWASAQGITLGQVAVDSKSNEITAIPQLLEMLELHGAIVSIDAMGCQREIASKIVASGGDYVLQVKGNQPTLQEAIEASFTEVDDLEKTNNKTRQRTTKEKSRGRQETRHYTIVPLPESMSACGKKWSGLRSIGRVVREVHREGKQTSETSYYITSRVLCLPNLISSKHERQKSAFSAKVFAAIGASRIACTG